VPAATIPTAVAAGTDTGSSTSPAETVKAAGGSAEVAGDVKSEPSTAFSAGVHSSAGVWIAGVVCVMALGY
jgi:hypothetical protein